MFSPNMLKTFQICHYKYWLKYVEQISVPQKASFFEKGKRIHAIANYYLRGDDISKFVKTLNNEEKIIWNNLQNNEYFKMKYVNSEYNLSCKVGEYWVGGRLDAVVSECYCEQNVVERGNLENDNNISANSLHPSPEFVNSQSSLTNSTLSHKGRGLYILDYKTGSIPINPEYDFQTMIYLLCLGKHVLPLREDRNLRFRGGVNFVYIDLKNNQNLVIQLTPEKIEEYEQAILQICKKITNYTPPENTEHSKKCEFCEYKKICI